MQVLQPAVYLDLLVDFLFLLGDAAFVICTERIPGVELIATNVFVREDDAWKMVHHHASSVAPPGAEAEPEEEEPESGSGTLH